MTFSTNQTFFQVYLTFHLGFPFFERATFRTFPKQEGCTKSLVFELETSNLGYLLVSFSFNSAKFQQDKTTLILDIL